MEIQLPKELAVYERGAKWVDIEITPKSTWRYKAHLVACHAAQKAFLAEYQRLMGNPAAMEAYVRGMEFVELDNAPERQSVTSGEKIVLMNDLLKTAKITIVEA